MQWDKLWYLLGIIIIGYAPYKLRQRFHKEGLNSLSSTGSILCGAWFVFLSFLLFRQSVAISIHTSGFFTALAGFTTALWFIAPVLVRHYGIRPVGLIRKKPGIFVFRLEPKTWYLKYFEVWFQQVKFLFVLSVVLAGFPNELKIFWFVAIIGFFHLNNVFFLPKGEGWIFFFLSIPAAYVFSRLILHGQLLLSTVIHQWFYIALGMYPWFSPKYANV